MLLLARYARSAAIKGSKNSRIHQFLPECIVCNQGAMRQFLPECIAPWTTWECHAVEPSLFAWIPLWESLLWFIGKATWRRSCLTFATLSFVPNAGSRMWKFAKLDNYLQLLNFVLSMSVLSSLASLFKFLKWRKVVVTEYLKQTKTVERAYFIYAAIYSFSCKHKFKLSSHV